MQQYHSDYDEMSPPAAYQPTGGAVYPNGSTGTYLLWYHLLMPYLKNVQIHNCPSYPGAPYTGGYHPPGGLGGNQFAWGLALATYTKPAELGLIMDAGWDRTTYPDISVGAGRPDGYYLLDWDIPSAATGGDNSPAPSPRHNQTTNVTFLDGHAKAIATTNIINGDTTSTAPSALPVGTLRNFWDPAAP